MRRVRGGERLAAGRRQTVGLATLDTQSAAGAGDGQRNAGGDVAIETGSPVDVCRGQRIGGLRRRRFLRVPGQIKIGNRVQRLGRAAAADVAKHRHRHALVGIARQVRAVAGGRSAVIHLPHPLVRVIVETECVVERPAVVEPADLLLPGDERGVADHRRGEVLVPLQEIADCRQQAAVAMDVLERHVDVKAVAAFVIGDSAVLHDAREIVAPGCVRHPERREDTRAGEFGKTHPADS